MAFLNLNPWELVVIAIVAVLVFGKRLPEVTARGYREALRLRSALERMRRESGIDRELQSIRRTFDDADREARALPRLEAPPEPRAARSSGPGSTTSQASPRPARPEDEKGEREEGAPR